MSDGPELNSLDRFRKRSGRLVLEQHSHCEVPAGCGGVVLRWRNPFAAVPLTVHLWTPVPAAVRIDGKELPSARIDLTPGAHMLTLAMQDLDLAAGLFLFVAEHVPPENEGAPASVVEEPLRVLSAADGSWKYSLEPPVGDWSWLGFDDGGWPALALAHVPSPQLKRHVEGAYQLQQCEQHGAVCLGLPIPVEGPAQASWWQRILTGRVAPGRAPVPGNLWVRKVFHVPGPTLQNVSTEGSVS